MAALGKRAFSPPLFQPESKKTRLSFDGRSPLPKWKTSATPGPSSVSKPPTQGTERVLCNLVAIADMKIINDLLVLHIRRLAREGKRLTHAPRILDDGINLDWVLDHSAAGDDLANLFTVKRIDKGVLVTVLERHAPNGIEMIDLVSDEDEKIASPTCNDGRNPDTAIVIDEDDDDISIIQVPFKDEDDTPATEMSIDDRHSPPSVALPGSHQGHLSLRSISPRHHDRSLSASSQLKDMANIMISDDEESVASVAKSSSAIGPLDESSSAEDDQHTTNSRSNSNSSDTSHRRTTSERKSLDQHVKDMYGGFALQSSEDETNRGEESDEEDEHPERLPQQTRGDDSPRKTTLSPGPITHRTPDPKPRRPPPRRKVILVSSSEESDGTESSVESDQPTSAAHVRERVLRDRPPRASINTRQTLSTEEGHSVILPKVVHAKGRRLLSPSGSTLPYVTIAMRGDAQFIRKEGRFRISKCSMPWPGVSDAHVQDACLLGDRAVVVGYDSGPSQVSIIPLSSDTSRAPRRINLRHRGHTQVHENPASGMSRPYRGISALASLSDSRFLSGGDDKTVRVWTVDPTDSYEAESRRLKVLHSTSVHAVAYRARDQCVLSAAGYSICTTHLAGHIPSDPVQVSGSVCHIHVHPQEPSLVVLEVKHMDRQVQIYDLRQGGFERQPCIEFGHRSRPEKKKKEDSRYVRGCPWMGLFARGYADGVVRVWDYRNPKNVITAFQCQRLAPVAHTLLSSSDIIAYGDHSVTFWRLNGSRS